MRYLYWFLVFLAFPTTAAAQEPSQPNPLQYRDAQEPAQRVNKLQADGRSESARLERMYEDIEILRRILQKSLVSRSLTATGNEGQAVAFSTDGSTVTSAMADGSVRVWDAKTGKQLRDLAVHTHPELAMEAPEGVYLPGQGVIFTMTLPLHFQEAFRLPDQPESKPESQWDRTRHEVRGEKPPAENKSRQRRDASIAEIVLKILAENGRHFSQLTEKEELTVAITLRPTKACIQCHQASSVSTQLGSAAILQSLRNLSDSSSGTAVRQLLGQVDQNLKAEAEQVSQKQRSEASNYNSLGDMRLRQGRYKEAAEAYLKAGQAYEGILRGQPPSDSNDMAFLAEVYTKMARAYLLLGESDRALQILKGVAGAVKKSDGQPVSAQPQDKPAKPELPAKYIIAAPKRLLDEVGSGKISFDEFKKQATINYWGFRLSDKKSDSNALPKSTTSPQTKG
jgi:tetratricopeptide (TPR) repeat protein